ncbi:VOC family protein [Staphylococcus saprophyticus]|uniref:VOC family protein n=1 Tax=Staphylococcus saprophyticus TaxID=29385 RepID=UPI000E68E398|nr:VOC family protein [Staphylococcus saprophyticus]RIO41493.1 VOC family protein [Staphylococcus saprophyticus]
MTTIFPYLNFENTKEALAYYEEVFGATNITRLPVGKDQAAHFNMSEAEAANATMHAQFDIAGTTVLASDSFGRAERINNEDDTREVEALYHRVKEAVDVEMPLEEQFWGGKMGAFTDKYNVRWMLHGQDYTKINK